MVQVYFRLSQILLFFEKMIWIVSFTEFSNKIIAYKPQLLSTANVFLSWLANQLLFDRYYCLLIIGALIHDLNRWTQ